MDFKFDQIPFFKFLRKEAKEEEPYVVLATDEEIKESEMEDAVQIVDESGKKVICSKEKFVEIFDKKGLSGFIL